jgi:phytoene synthase
VPALDGVDPRLLADAYAHCARVVQSRARNFYHGLRLTPEPRRSAIYSIYAWMRAADDCADAPEPADVRSRRLDQFAQRTARILEGQLPHQTDEPYWLALAATVASYPIDPVIFFDMLAGLRDDLHADAQHTDDDLSRYCYRVAGTAGLACVWIWGLKPGADPARASALALRRGQAFQRTNILRDLAQDYDDAPSRVYIPRDALVRHGLSPADLRAWARPEACAALVLEQAAIADEHYRASAELEAMIDAACAPTLWAMTRIYSGLLDIIRADPARVAGPRRIRLSGAVKAGIALRAAVMARVGRW